MDFAISDRFGSEFENELQFGSIQFRILKKTRFGTELWEKLVEVNLHTRHSVHYKRSLVTWYQ